MSDDDWNGGHAQSLAIFLNGHGIPDRDELGERIVDDSFLLLINAHHQQVTFTLPDAAYGRGLGGRRRHRRPAARARPPPAFRARRPPAGPGPGDAGAAPPLLTAGRPRRPPLSSVGSLWGRLALAPCTRRQGGDSAVPRRRLESASSTGFRAGPSGTFTEPERSPSRTVRFVDVLARPTLDQRNRSRRAGSGGRQRPAGGPRRAVRRDAHDDAVPVPGLQFPRGDGEAVPGSALWRGYRGDRPRRADRHHDRPPHGRLPEVHRQGGQAARRAGQGRGDSAQGCVEQWQHPPLPGRGAGRAARGRRREPLVRLLRLQQRQPGARPALQPDARVDRAPAEVPDL